MKRLFLLFICAALGASAGEVTREMAAKAARRWRLSKDVLGCSIGSTVASSRTVTTAKAKFNVVTFEGGGAVVTSADTSIRPIVFFSDGDDVDENPENPLMELLETDLALCQLAATNTVAQKQYAAGAVSGTSATAANEQAWAELLSDQPLKQYGVSVTDLRAGPFLSTTWSQGYAYNSSGSDGVWCYNYYTPNHYVCGCVATATAQVMRYFKWPTASVEAKTNPNCEVSGTKTSQTMKGGTYNWDLMPLFPSRSDSWQARAAIGKLTYDVGVATAMSWASGGSGTSTMVASWALKNVFGYKQAIAAHRKSYSSSSSWYTQVILKSNFDAGLPVLLGLSNHSIVGDGYGYSSGSLCYHLNYGWGGSSNGWYCPPDLGNDYSAIYTIVYNIFTTQSASSAIVSGRILLPSGAVAAGVTVQALSGSTVKATATTNSRGIFALYVPASSTYTIKATSGTTSAKTTATTSSIVTMGIVTSSGMPTGAYYPANDDAAPCNAIVGDLKLQEDRPPLAKIGDTIYYSWDDVIGAVAAGETLTLLADNASAAMTVTNNVTLDLGGYTFGAELTLAAEVTVKNGTASVVKITDGRATLEDVTVASCTQTASGGLTLVSGKISSLLVQDCVAVTRLAGGNVETLTATGGAEVRTEAASTCQVTTLSCGNTRAILDGGSFGTVRLKNCSLSQAIGAACHIGSLTATDCTGWITVARGAQFDTTPVYTRSKVRVR